MHFEARHARRQYEAVDPDHRLVAAELERRWNEALAAVARLDEELTRQKTNDRPPLSPEQRAQLLALGADLERVWEHPAAAPETRKRILRTVLKEIVVRAVDERLELKLQWQGGDHSELSVVKNRTGQHRWTTPDEIEELLSELARILPDQAIAALLNRWGKRTAKGHTWTAACVCAFRSDRRIATYREGPSRRCGCDCGARHAGRTRHPSASSIPGPAGFATVRRLRSCHRPASTRDGLPPVLGLTRSAGGPQRMTVGPSPVRRLPASSRTMPTVA